MKLSTVSILSAIAIFVATLPHGVGAWIIKTTHLEPVIVKLHSKEAVLASPRLLAQSIAKKKLNKMFGKDAKKEWKALTRLWGKESAWNWKARILTQLPLA